MMINRKDANELHEILDLWFTKLLTNSPIPNSILSGLRILRYLAWSFTIFVFIVTINYMASPIISIIHQNFEHVNSIKYSLPYPGVYPWSIDPPGLSYKLQLFIELIATVPLFCVTAGIDSLFTMYGFQMSENYHMAIYACDWHRNRRFMTSVLIMLTQKPLTLTACNFAIVSLDIFGA
ncbi:hypothetical protein PV327_011152, partial [Microctonus hyperodae]